VFQFWNLNFVCRFIEHISDIKFTQRISLDSHSDLSRIDRNQHLSVFDVRLLKRADCATDHCFVFGKVREKLLASKQAAQTFGLERFNLKKLNEVEVWE